jgi:hypothetical protein
VHKFRTGHQGKLILNRKASYFQRKHCSFSLYTETCISSHSSSTERQMTITFTVHSRNNGPHYGTRFTSPFWRLEFGHSSLIFVIFAAPGQSHLWLLFYLVGGFQAMHRKMYGVGIFVSSDPLASPNCIHNIQALSRESRVVPE